jgi:outer membrane receptor for ferrienterochelin and colicin
VIQAMYQGIEIEMEMHQQAEGHWKCDYTLIRHPQRSVTIEHVAAEFPTFDLARAHALEQAHAAIDKML